MTVAKKGRVFGYPNLDGENCVAEIAERQISPSKNAGGLH